MKYSDKELLHRARQIKLIVFDIDGVLTDGGLIFSEAGDELKRFNTRDGLAMRLAMDAGLEVAWLSARDADLVRRRAEEVGVRQLIQGMPDKLPGLLFLLEQNRVTLTEIAYLGDDLLDLPVLTQVGLPIAVADAVAEVKEAALYVCQKNGGDGAAREVVELILKTQGKWSSLIEKYKK